MSITREQEAAIAQEVARLCEKGTEALEALERPLSAFYAEQVAADGELASAARSAIGAYSSSRAFEPVSVNARSIAEGFMGFSAVQDGKRIAEWCTDYLEYDELFRCIGRLAVLALDSGAADGSGELVTLSQAVIDAREAAIAALSRVVGAYA